LGRNLRRRSVGRSHHPEVSVNIVVLVKYVPNPQGTPQLGPDNLLVRSGVDPSRDGDRARRSRARVRAATVSPNVTGSQAEALWSGRRLWEAVCGKQSAVSGEVLSPSTAYRLPPTFSLPRDKLHVGGALHRRRVVHVRSARQRRPFRLFAWFVG
jgi:hypothetical protein